MKKYLLISILSIILINNCKKEISISAPTNLSYTSSIIEVYYGVGGISATPSISWNGENGSFIFSNTTNNTITINSTSGVVTWSKETPVGNYSISIQAKNSAGVSNAFIIKLNIKEVYSIKFDSKGGSFVDSIKNILPNSKATKPTTIPTLTKFLFVDWYESNDAGTTLLTNPFDFINTSISKNYILYAKYRSVPSYTLTYDLDGGNGGPTNATLDSNTSISALTSPTKAGFTFNGWLNGTTSVTLPFNITSNTTLKASWIVNSTTYNLTYENAGATGNLAQNVSNSPINTTINAPTNPTKTGYKFVNWLNASTGAVVNFPFNITSNTALIAKWIAQYTLTYSVDGGTGTYTNATLDSGSSVAVPASSTKTNYKFINWINTKNSAVVSTAFNITENTILLAKWVQQYTLTYDLDGGTAGATNATLDSNSSVATPTAPTKSGFTFNGWLNGATSVTFPFNIITNTTLKASWTAIATTYNLTYENAGATSNLAQNVSNIASGTSISAPTNPTKTGYKFVNWLNASTGAVVNFPFNITSNTALIAKWIAQYTLTYNVDGGTGTYTNATLDSGSSVAVPASSTKTNYKFINWINTKNSAVVSTAFNITENTILLAKWVQQYTLTYDLDGGTAGPTNATLDSNSSVATPTAPTKSGFTFNGWLNGATNVNFPFNLTSNTTLKAFWTANATTYNLTYENAGATSNLAQNVSNIASGTSISAPTNPTKTGYKFVNWLNASTGAVVNFPFNITSNTNLIAKWIAQYTLTYSVDGGTGTYTNATLDSGSSVAVPASSTKTNYKFINWINTKNSAVVSNAFNITENTILLAKWVQQYTLTYDLDGGTAGPTNATLDSNSSVTTPNPAPTKSGFTFNGWLNGATSVTFPFNIITNTTLKAKWYPAWASENWGTTGDGVMGGDFTKDWGKFKYDYASNTFKDTLYLVKGKGIKFRKDDAYTNSAGSTNSDGVLNFAQGSNNIIVPSSGRFIIIFNLGNGTPSYTLTKIENRYDVNFNSVGGSAVAAIQGLNTGTQTITKPANPTKNGFTFDDWYQSTDNGVSYTTVYSFTNFNISTDITMYALWIPATSTQTWSVLGEFNSWGADVPFTYNKLTNRFEATITANGGTGIKFRKDNAWTTNFGSNSNNGFLDASSNTNINLPGTGSHSYKISFNMNFDGTGNKYSIVALN